MILRCSLPHVRLTCRARLTHYQGRLSPILRELRNIADSADALPFVLSCARTKEGKTVRRRKRTNPAVNVSRHAAKFRLDIGE